MLSLHYSTEPLGGKELTQNYNSHRLHIVITGSPLPKSKQPLWFHLDPTKATRTTPLGHGWITTMLVSQDSFLYQRTESD